MATASAPKITPKAGARVKPRKKHPNILVTTPQKPPKGWMCIGIDSSLNSIAMAAMAYDAITRKFRGPAFEMLNFTKEDDYFERLRAAVTPHDMIFDLQRSLNVIMPKEDLWIAQEEPFPAHGNFMQRGHSQTLKQQAEISGAILGGLAKWGYGNIYQIGNHQWRQFVAEEISGHTGEQVTIHHSKWRSPMLVERFNCKPQDSGKFRAQQWARDVFEPWSFQQTEVEIPEFPPMIQSKDGKKPRPPESKAKAFQCDDRYEALAMCAWMMWERDRLFKGAAV